MVKEFTYTISTPLLNEFSKLIQGLLGALIERAEDYTQYSEINLPLLSSLIGTSEISELVLIWNLNKPPAE